MQEFQKLLATRKRKAAQIVTKEELAAQAQDKAVVQAAAAYTVEGIVKGLADSQLLFNRATKELGATLLSEMPQLEQVRRAIEVESLYLQELDAIELAANALDILQQEEEARVIALEAQNREKREAFEQKVAVQRADWDKEEQAYAQAVTDYDTALLQAREAEESDFVYKLERKRRVEADQFAAKRQKIEHELAEKREVNQKEWLEREQVIAAQQKELQEDQTRVAAFPAEMSEAVQAAKAAAVEEATREAQVKAALLKKEIEANEKVNELEIQTLEESIARQNRQIEALSAELGAALKQAQVLAAKALSGSAGAEPSLSGQNR